MGRAQGSTIAVATAKRRTSRTVHAPVPVPPIAEHAIAPYDPDVLPVARALRELFHDREFIAREKLLEPEYRNSPNPYTGHCYAASEALFHLLGGFDSDFRPCRVKLKEAHGQIPAGTRHWWLIDSAGRRLDISGEQFPERFPYEQGTNGGFLTRVPSERARKFIARVRADHPELGGHLES